MYEFTKNDASLFCKDRSTVPDGQFWNNGMVLFRKYYCLMRTLLRLKNNSGLSNTILIRT